MPKNKKKPHLHIYHRFLDEAGDTTFFGKGKTDIIGEFGVSKAFMIGMVACKTGLLPLRERIIELQKQVENDPYFSGVPSIQKKIQQGGFIFHATDDIPEVRKLFFDVLKYEFDFSCEVMVARKIPQIFMRKHNGKENELYADVLGHLLKSKLRQKRLVLNIAERGSSTRSNNLEFALEKAKERKKDSAINESFTIGFNIQTPRTEPLLAIPDYALWAVQRVFERGETRYYDFLSDKFPLILDLYDRDNYEGYKNYYGPKNLLTALNKID